MQMLYLKLLNGDELIGQVPDEDVSYDTRRLLNPWRMMLTSKGYVPCPMPAKSITVSSAHVLFDGEVDDDLLRVYNEQMGGIVTPKPGLHTL